ncbi:hypothetical protein [Kordia sp.]|uniref:hypothetical protein n=1 Tax=Kordia sp. TaxID=1965332 RepID=UPI003D6AE91C
MKNKLNIFFISLLVLQFSCSKSDTISFKVSTNYLDGKPYLSKTKTFKNLDTKVDISFFKKQFSKFYGIPNELIHENLKNQEITEWGFKEKPKKLFENLSETFMYDSEGRLIEYKYSSCTICSQMPWGYKLLYNKNNDVIEQQIYDLKQDISANQNGLIITYKFKDEIDTKIKLTYDNNRNIIKFEKIGKKGLEELIELVK